MSGKTAIVVREVKLGDRESKKMLIPRAARNKGPPMHPLGTLQVAAPALRSACRIAHLIHELVDRYQLIRS